MEVIKSIQPVITKVKMNAKEVQDEDDIDLLRNDLEGIFDNFV